jgi:hypothetical protein
MMVALLTLPKNPTVSYQLSSVNFFSLFSGHPLFVTLLLTLLFSFGAFTPPGISTGIDK